MLQVAGFYTEFFAKGGIRFHVFLNMYSLPLSFGFVVEFGGGGEPRVVIGIWGNYNIIF